MYKGRRIGVVVPAYNEEKLIGKTLSTMPDFVDLIIVVDDHSTDKTSEIAKKTKTKARKIIMRQPRNKGVGYAIFDGYKRGADEGMDVLAVMAGDAQMDPNELEDVIGPVAAGEADYVKGNRLMAGTPWKDMPFFRYFGNNILAFLTKVASGYWHIGDPQCGYTAISTKVFPLLDWKHLWKRYGYCNDLLVHMNVESLRVKDVPVFPVYGEEVSGIHLRWYVPKLSYLLLKRFIWRLYMKYLVRDFHPLIFFYLFGTILLAAGMAFGAFLAFASLTEKVSTAKAILDALLLLAGLQLLLFAMWQDSESNRHLR